MRVGSLASGKYVRKPLSYAAGTIVRARSLGLRTWAILNYNLVEGILLPRRYLAVCLERGSVSVACGSRFLNRSYLKGSKRYSFEGDGYVTPANLATTVSLAREELHCDGSWVLLGVPREWVVMRAAELPSVVKENLDNVVAYEIDRLTPFNAGDAMYDYFISAEKDGRLTISLMAVKKGSLEPYVAALSEVGSAPVKISTPLTGMARLCGSLAGNGSCMVLHAGNHGFEGGFVDEGGITSTFYGSFDSSGDNRGPNGPCEDILSVLAQHNGGGKQTLLYLLSENDNVKALETVMGTAVRELKDRDIVSLFRSEEEGVPYAPACMLYETLSNGTRSFNLASTWTGKGKSPFVATLVLVALLVAMMVPYVVVPIEMEKRRINEIEYQIRVRKKDVKTVEALNKDIDLIQNEIHQIDGFKRSRPMSLGVLKELTTLLPKTVWLTRTRVTEQTVEIEGYASSATSVLSLLEESDLFKKVEFASPTVKDTRLNSDRFVIRMEIEGFGKQTDVKERTDRKDGDKK
ncbi:MAG: PilN domain-containing protein [Syntrophorhabdaceae bacterium]|nr:PilN domain-containing protein [Syntrophorhabdaceae bacterium]